MAPPPLLTVLLHIVGRKMDRFTCASMITSFFKKNGLEPEPKLAVHGSKRGGADPSFGFGLVQSSFKFDQFWF